MIQMRNKLKFKSAVRSATTNKAEDNNQQLWTAMMAFMIMSELPTTGYIIQKGQCCNKAEDNALANTNEEGLKEGLKEEIESIGCTTSSSGSIFCPENIKEEKNKEELKEQLKEGLKEEIESIECTTSSSGSIFCPENIKEEKNKEELKEQIKEEIDKETLSEEKKDLYYIHERIPLSNSTNTVEASQSFYSTSSPSGSTSKSSSFSSIPEDHWVGDPKDDNIY